MRDGGLSAVAFAGRPSLPADDLGNKSVGASVNRPVPDG